MSARPRFLRIFKRLSWPLPVAIAAIGFTATFALANGAARSSERLDEQHYEEVKTDTLRRIDERVRTYEDAFLGGTALFAASKSVERDEWRAYAGGVSLTTRYPGLLGVGVIRVVPDEAVASFEAAQRADFPGFTVRPVPGFVSDGTQYIITFIEPVAPNAAAMGIDVASEPVRKFAAERSRDQGTTAFSGSITLVQDGQKRPGFLMYRPIYKNGMPASTVDERRAALEGWVYAPFVTEEFFAGVFGLGSTELDVHIYKGPEANVSEIVFDSSAELGAANPGAHQNDIQALVIKGELFTIGFARSDTFASAGHGTENAVLTFGGISSLALAAMIWALMGARRRAEMTAERATRKLRETGAIQRAIVDESAYSIIATTLDGTITTFNPAAEALLGYTAEELIGKADTGIFHDAQEVLARAAVLSNEYGTTVEPGFETFIYRARLSESDEQRWTYIRKDGRRVPVRLAVAALHGEDGELTGYVGLARDLSVEERAQAAEARLAAIVDASSDAILSTDATGQIVSWNHGAEVLFGYTAGEIIGTLGKLRPPELIAEVVMTREAMSEGRTLAFDTVRLRKDGTRIDVSATLSPMRDAAGAVVGLGSVLRDITEKKKSELAQARLAAIVDASGDAMFSVDVDGNMMTWNPGAEQLLGYSRSEAVGMSGLALFPPGGLAEAVDIRAAMKSGETLRYDTVRARKDGSLVEVSATLSPLRDLDGEIVAMASVLRDITEKKKLDLAQARLAAIVGASGDAMYSMDLDGKLNSWNRGAELLLGYTQEEAIGMDAHSFLPPDMAGEADEIRSAINEDRVIRFDTIRQRKNGKLIDVSATLSPMKDAAGNVVGMASVVRDITEKKKFAEAQARLATIVGSSADAMISFGLDGVPLTWNKGAEVLLGYTEAEAIGNKLDLFGPSMKAEAREVGRAMRDGRVLTLETRRMRKDGSIVDVSASIAPVFDAAGSVMGGASVMRDITLQVQAKLEMEEMVEVLQSNSFVLMEQAEELERLARESEYLANHDALTGVLNRRSWWNSASDGEVTAVAVLDIDFFKKVNDTHGHPGGDVVLREVAERLATTLGESGSLGRIGGEEFGITFRGTWEEAEVAARRCIERLPLTPITIGPGVELTVSLSGGLAPWAGGDTLEEALKATYDQADHALYEAKETGRRRLCLAPDQQRAA